MPYNRKPRFMLVISGIRLTFVDDFRLNADYLAHLNSNKDVGGSSGAWPKQKILSLLI